MKKIINREFHIKFPASNETGELNETVKKSLLELLLSELKLIPNDKHGDLAYMDIALTLYRKLQLVKVFDEIELTEKEFEIFKAAGERHKPAFLDEGLLDFKKMISELKYE